MELAHIAAFNLALFAAIIGPGPAFLIAVQNTLLPGEAAGIGLGLVATICIYPAFGLQTSRMLARMEEHGVEPPNGRVQPAKGLLKPPTVNVCLRTWGFDQSRLTHHACHQF